MLPPQVAFNIMLSADIFGLVNKWVGGLLGGGDALPKFQRYSRTWLPLPRSVKLAQAFVCSARGCIGAVQEVHRLKPGIRTKQVGGRQIEIKKTQVTGIKTAINKLVINT
jgi:hypothetical protein